MNVATFLILINAYIDDRLSTTADEAALGITILGTVTLSVV